MRKISLRILGALVVILTSTNSANAQVNFIKPRPSGASQQAGEAPVSPAGNEVSPIPSARVSNVSPNSALVPGAEVSFNIVEENEPPTRVIIADTGDLEIPGGLGRVQVGGLTAAQAASRIKGHLEGRYYKPGKATVQVGLNTLPASGQKRSKVIISGKVLRAGAVEFFPTDPKTLSEAVNEAGTSIYSDTKRVKVTRGTQTNEYNVKDILEKGATKNDFPLRDGDRIYVPDRTGLIW
jgi:protein involved in polysaccharide export with SLBB domain